MAHYVEKTTINMFSIRPYFQSPSLLSDWYYKGWSHLVSNAKVVYWLHNQPALLAFWNEQRRGLHDPCNDWNLVESDTVWRLCV